MSNIKNEKYYYKVYGLSIESEIEIEEFIVNENKEVDVSITINSMPGDIGKLFNEGRRSDYSKDRAWFHIDNIADYYISDGKTIIVKPYENFDKTMLKVYLMCSCIGFIMLQRDKIAIHGGVVTIDDNGVIFTGDRGAGKSTLTTALRNRGYRFISDDVAATYIDKVPYVHPGFPYQKLCDDIVEDMGYEKEKCESIVGYEKVKYIVPAYDSFHDESIELNAICKLTVGDVDKVIVEELKGKDKIDNIIQNIYRGEFLGYMGGVTPEMFKQCLLIAKNIKFYKITRPKEGYTINEQINLIESIFKNEIENVV